jgi:hypothetical protein
LLVCLLCSPIQEACLGTLTLSCRCRCSACYDVYVPHTQLTEGRLAELTARLASAEDKVTHLKGERSRLYQQLASSTDATRTQVCVGGGVAAPD